MGADRALRDLIRPHLDTYYDHCFERLCRETLPRLYRQEGIVAAFEVGQYWSKTTQIDVVGLRDDNWTEPRRMQMESCPLSASINPYIQYFVLFIK